VKSYFLGLFGRSERITACACERNNEVTLSQILHLNAGVTLAQKLKAADGRLAALLKLKMSDLELIDEIFMIGFGPPVQSGGAAHRGTAAPAPRRGCPKSRGSLPRSILGAAQYEGVRV